jgi:hypothetical protein
MFHLFRTYVVANAFTLQVFHQQSWLRGADRGGPLGCGGLRVHTGSQEGTTASVEHKAISTDVVAGVEHEAACMLSFSLCLSLSLFQLDAAGQQQHHVPTAGVRGQAWPVATAPNGSGRDNFPPQVVKSEPISKGTGEEARTGAAWESRTRGR